MWYKFNMNYLNFNFDKFSNMILFFIENNKNNHTFCKTKLAKLLFYSDFICYDENNYSISNDIYIHYPRGPVPSEMNRTIKELTKKDIIREIERKKVFGGIIYKYFTLYNFNADIFNKNELDIMRKIQIDLYNKSAAELSEYSHEFIGWQITRTGEEIDYELAKCKTIDEALKLKKTVDSLDTTDLIMNTPHFKNRIQNIIEKPAQRLFEFTGSLTDANIIY